MPLPGRPSGVGGVFVLQRGAGTSLSACPRAGPFDAVNLPSASIQGAFDKETVLIAGALHASQSDEDVAQPAPSKTPAAKALTKVSVLEVIGALSSVL